MYLFNLINVKWNISPVVKNAKKISHKKQTKQTFERTNKSKIESKNKRTQHTVPVKSN